MKATVISIESKSLDNRDAFAKQRRIGLAFEGSFAHFFIWEKDLGIIGIALDDEVEVTFRPLRQEVLRAIPHN